MGVSGGLKLRGWVHLQSVMDASELISEHTHFPSTSRLCYYYVSEPVMGGWHLLGLRDSA